MRSLLMAVLLLAAAASAQPLAGPFTVLEISAPYNLSNPHLVLRDNSTADLFYQMADTVYHSTVLLSSGAILAGPQAMSPDSGFSRRLCDAIWTDSGWVALCYDTTDHNNRTLIYKGYAAYEYAAEIHFGLSDPPSHPGLSSSRSRSLNLIPRRNGGFMATWLDDWMVWAFGGFQEGGTTFVTADYQSDGTLIEQTGCESFAIDGSQALPLVSISDSIRILCGNDYHTLLTTTWGDMYNCHEEFTWACSTTPRNALILTGDRILVVSSSTDTGARLFELDSSACNERFSFVSNPLSATSIKTCGISWLSKLGEELYLYRIDTLAMEHFPAGQLYVPAGTNQVADAHMDITSTGKIALCWTERPAPGTNANTIKIASLGWNTALGADDPHSILPPSAFTLSAYPNPFNSTLRVEYSLPVAGRSELAMYNLLGQKVAVLKDGMLETGHAIVNWTPEGAGGIYFAVLKTATQSRTAKVVYLK